VSRWIIIFTSLAIDVSTGMISHSFVHGLSAGLTFVIGGARWASQWCRLVVEIKACWFFEVSSTILTIYPIIFSLIVNLPAIMTYVVASVFETSIARLVKIIIHLDTSVACYLWITTIDRRNRLTSFSILNVHKMTGSSVNKDTNLMKTKNVFIANHRGVELSNINLIYV
jgi:hypothetical protein